MRRWVLWSAVAATAVVALSFATADGLLAGVAAATRNSALVSALLFTVALTGRAGRPARLAANQLQLTLGFVAAHGIHYGTVLARIAIDPANPMRHPSVESIVVVAGGVGLLALVAVTARARSATAVRAHAIAFYFVAALFAVALAPHVRAEAAAALVLAALVAAFVWRVGAAFGRRHPSGA